MKYYKNNIDAMTTNYNKNEKKCVLCEGNLFPLNVTRILKELVNKEYFLQQKCLERYTVEIL